MARCTVVVGGTSGIGRSVAERSADRGDDVVVTGRDAGRARAVADEIGGGATAVALDLTDPDELSARLAPFERVDRLVLAAVHREPNALRRFDLGAARRLATLKLVGYAEVVHVLAARMPLDGSVVLCGGYEKDRPHEGATGASIVNAGITGMVQTLAVELAPIRVNAVHPGVVGDSPAWASSPAATLESFARHTLTRRLATTDDVARAIEFLLDNGSVNAVDLPVDGGWRAC